MANTKFTIEKRDLFTVPKDYYLCHCISADFALGAGIAKKFAEMGVRNSLYLNYNRYYHWIDRGECLFTNATEWKGEYNLVTKDKCFHKPTINTLKQALVSMWEHCHNEEKIAMPKIGCGLDKLNWCDVEQIIKDVFADTDVEILVCDWK